MIQDVEKKATMLKTSIIAREMKIGGFLPSASARCPEKKLPTNSPIICTEAIIVGIHELWQTKSH